MKYGCGFNRVMAVLSVMALVFIAGCGEDEPASPSSKPSTGPKIWYVDLGASGSASGSSWTNAFAHPQQAVDAASSGDQIWVAAGNYMSLNASNDTVPVLTMMEGVEIYGGFAGDEKSLSSRDPEIHITRLNGNNQAFHVVLGADNARLDGFWIQGGNAAGADFPHKVGGGMYNGGTSPVVENCTFYANLADQGGGAYNSSSSQAVFVNCKFDNNLATNTTSSAGGGGGLYNSYSYTTVDSCDFISNHSLRHGGGMFNNASSPVITVCRFRSNVCENKGGGMYNNSYGVASRKPTLTDCEFENNDAEDGGGMYNFYCSSIVEGCTFEDNDAGYNGGGAFNYNSYARLTDCVFNANECANNGGGLYNQLYDQGSSPVIKNCMVKGNRSGHNGGGIYNDLGSPQILSCTLTGNSAAYGGAIVNYNGAATITDCIAWGNSADYSDPQFRFTGATLPLVTFSDVDQAGYGLSPGGDADGNGNIRKDPLFWTGPQGNYYLSQIVCGQASNSPCVDAGSSTAEILGMVNRSTRTDEGIDSGTVDMGYHYLPQ
ncbi:MAG: hypothetical protein JXB45_04115 [Candidatus Krumholzibacteriota bacterium]|nr:hypothetical protein [Candidatus Krumholzibacteriota bacterium]